MKRVIKRAVSFVLVFMTVFSVFTILPSEVFHTAYVKAAEMFSSETSASAQETYTTDDFTYTLIDEYSKVQILSYIGSDTDVVIPDRIDNKKVTSIADSAFREKSITSVVFGQYVESIGNNAFYSCQSLNKLDFSKSSVKTIGNCAFMIDKSLESIEFPDSLESIGPYAFSCYSYGTYGSYYASNLKSVKFGSGLKTVDEYAFYKNEKLETIEFAGNNLTSIGNNAFSSCSALTELNLSGNKTIIRANAFSYDTSLKSVTISSGVNRLCDYAFYKCTALTTVELGEGLETMEGSVFRYCSSLEKVSFPESLVNIYGNTFDSCSKLDNVKIPNNLTYIDGYVFSNCSSLKNVSIGSSCKSVSTTAFLNSYSIDKITVAEDNKNFTSVDGVLYNNDKTTLVLYPKNRAGEFVVPDTVTSIADYAFDNAPKLTKVTIGENVKSVGTGAFRNCNSLETVIFKDSDTVQKTIGDYAFNNCPALTEVDFGNAVKSIGNYAFMVDKLLESIEFPDSLESIGYCAFSCYRGGTYSTYVASNLKSVKFGSGLKTIGNYALYGNRSLETVQFSGKNLTSIGEDAFRDCMALTKLNLTGNDAVICARAFCNNDALKEVTLSGVKTIGYNAFGGDDALKSADLGEDLISIDSYAFQSCSNLETVTLPESLTTINNDAFRDCSKLASIEIPNKVTKLNDNTFANCTSLKNVSIGSGCASISSTAFLNSNAIEKITVAGDNANYSSVDGALLNKEKTSIVLYPKSKSGEFVIPDTVTSIADYAFDNAPKLTKVTIGENVKSVGTGAFRNCNSLETVIFKDSDTVQKQSVITHLTIVLH